LPPPTESLLSMQQGAASSAAAASSSASVPSHRCAVRPAPSWFPVAARSHGPTCLQVCGSGIRNDLRRQLAGSGEIGGWRTHDAVGPGEYRFHCS